MGTSGAEIGAAFGGNKVDRDPFAMAFLSGTYLSSYCRALDGRFPSITSVGIYSA